MSTDPSTRCLRHLALSLPGNMLLISGSVPLAELNGYQSRLKGMTGGQGSFSMEFSHYEVLPANLQQEIVAQYKPHDGED